MNKSKRNLVKILGIAGGASAWQAPVVNSVMLPAHGATSMLIFSSAQVPGIESDDVTSNTSAEGNLVSNLSDTLIPQAQAQSVENAHYGCAMVMGATADVTIAGVADQFPDANAIRRGTLNLPAPMGSGGDGTITASAGEFNSGCPPRNLTLTARILSVSTTAIQIQWDRPSNEGPRSISITLPVAGSCASEPSIADFVC